MTRSTVSLERAWLRVDLGALSRNARRLAALVNRPLLAMVKADAYGLGALRVAGTLESVDPWGYGVATVAEGAVLRSAGIERPIVVFTPARAQELPSYAALELRAVVGDLDTLAACVAAGHAFHVEIDTGMSRSGFRWTDSASLQALTAGVTDASAWEGIFTHFHSAESNPDATEVQWARFERVLASLPRRPGLVHAANSAACAAGARYAGDLVRPGIFLYGASAGSLTPEPVASLHARVVALRRLGPGDTVSYDAEAIVNRETTVATLAIGYADGVPRRLGNRGKVAIHGGFAPILGRVTMDMTMIDVSDLPVQLGEVATVFGDGLSLDEQAAVAGTNSYEMLTRITARVPRLYHTKERA
jgi:alanine racemase